MQPTKMMHTTLTPSAIKTIHDSSAADYPKRLDLLLQVLKVEEMAQNPEKKDAAKIKLK